MARHGGHGRRRRRRGDGCRSRATWASGQAGHPERRCLSPRPWRPNVPLVGGELNGAGGGGRGAAGRARRGRGGVRSWPRRRGGSPTVKPAAGLTALSSPLRPARGRDDLQADGLGQSRPSARGAGAEVVPAGTADRGDTLSGVSVVTVPTAGAVRESTIRRRWRRSRERDGAIQRMSLVSSAVGSPP